MTESHQEVGRLRRHSRVKLIIAIVLGVIAAILVPVPTGSQSVAFSVLVGFCLGAATFSVSTLMSIMRMDADQTKSHVQGLSPSRTEVDLTVLFASFGALVAIALMLVGGSHKPDATKVIEGIVTIACVAAAWLSIHTTYSLRYAKQYYNVEPGCIDFFTDTPLFSDFAYLAFDLGMTYQVSDTSVKTSAARRIVFGHTLLSYVFGACIVASAMNLVIGLVQ